MRDVATTDKLDAVIGGMGGSARNELARLRDEVARSRERLGFSIAELERRVSVAGSWRRWVRARPWTSVLVGLCAGYLVGRSRRRGAPDGGR